jgi:hypothetical protein
MAPKRLPTLPLELLECALPPEVGLPPFAKRFSLLLVRFTVGLPVKELPLELLPPELALPFPLSFTGLTTPVFNVKPSRCEESFCTLLLGEREFRDSSATADRLLLVAALVEKFALFSDINPAMSELPLLCNLPDPSLFNKLAPDVLRDVSMGGLRLVRPDVDTEDAAGGDVGPPPPRTWCDEEDFPMNPPKGGTHDEALRAWRMRGGAVDGISEDAFC